MRKTCPFCSSNNVIRILYGMPNKKGIEDYNKGLIHLGGCCISPVVRIVIMILIKSIM